MKEFINSALRNFGVQIVRTATLDRMQDELARLQEASPIHRVYGHTVRCDPADIGIRLVSMARTAIEDSEDHYFVRYLTAGQTALDLGANIGVYSLLFARLVGPSGKVFAFEPGPKSYALLQQNIEANGYANIETQNAAVSDRSGSITLHVCPTGESDNRVEGLVDPSNGWERVVVPCLTVDDYLKGCSVDLIKMDIQGSEFAALKGMRRTLERNRDIKLVMEFCPSLIDDHGAFFQFIREAGLSIFALDGKRMTPEYLLATVGNAGQPQHANILLHR